MWQPWTVSSQATTLWALPWSLQCPFVLVSSSGYSSITGVPLTLSAWTVIQESVCYAIIPSRNSSPNLPCLSCATATFGKVFWSMLFTRRKDFPTSLRADAATQSIRGRESWISEFEFWFFWGQGNFALFCSFAFFCSHRASHHPHPSLLSQPPRKPIYSTDTDQIFSSGSVLHARHPTRIEKNIPRRAGIILKTFTRRKRKTNLSIRVHTCMMTKKTGLSGGGASRFSARLRIL